MVKIPLDEAVVILAPHMSYHPSMPHGDAAKTRLHSGSEAKLIAIPAHCTESQLSSGEVPQGRVLDNAYTKPHDANKQKDN